MSDPNYADVVLSIHGNGTNGSTTIPDTSPSPMTVTANGDAAIDTSNKQWGTGSIAMSAGYLAMSDMTALSMGTVDFTLEGWFYTGDVSSNASLYVGMNSFKNSYRGPQVGIGSGGIQAFCGGTTGTLFGITSSGSFVLSTNTWYYWAYVRSGSNFKLYLNGTQVGSTATSASACGVPANVSIGQEGAGSNFVGFIDDVRVTKVARSITASPTAEFDDSAGSPGFAASGVATASGSATLSVTHAVLAAAGFAGASGSGVLIIPAVFSAAGRAAASGSGALTVRAVLAASGKASSVGTAGLSFGALLQAAAAQTLLDFGTGAHANGGTTEPTDPDFVTVMLLLHNDVQSNGQIVVSDSSNSRKWVSLLGNAAGTTSAPKFGSGSVAASAGAIRVDDPNDFNFGAGDFTIEGWSKLPNTFPFGSGDLNICLGHDVSGNVRLSIVLNALTFRAKCYDSSGTVFGSVTNTASISNSTWFHWAYVRIGTAHRLYIDGVTGSSGTSTAGQVQADLVALRFGCDINGNNFFTGSYDEIRVSKALGRYTTGFSVATTAFADSGSQPLRSAAAAQTMDPFVQAATVYGAGQRSAAAAQTMDPFAQVYLVSAPSRVVQSSTTFVFAQVATVITTADRNLITPGDAYYGNVAYLLHGDSSTSSGGWNYELDSSKNNWPVQASLLTSVVTDALAYGGKAIQFTAAAGSAITQFSYDSTPFDFTKSTTELRIRFDTLTDLITGTPDPLNPGDYTFDATLQQTGWFFSSGNGGGAMRVGLAGFNGAFEADWSSITMSGSSINFAPYVLQLKGTISFGGGSYTINNIGVLPVTTGWHNVTIERDGATVKVYLDGAFDFTFSLFDVNATFLDGTFIAGADTTNGFAFNAQHTNLSAIEEMRHTWGVVRHGAPFTPSTSAFPGFGLGVVPAFAQVATITHGGSATRLVAGAQTMPAFGQVASCFGAGALSAAAAQTLPAFGQAASCYGAGQRSAGATQFMDPFTNVATVAPPRYIDVFAQPVAPFGQTATITTVRTAAAAQTLAIGQVAQAIHAVDHAVGGITFVFGQVATVLTLASASAKQALAFSQVATAVAIAKAQATQAIPPFIPSTLIQGAFISISERTFQVRGEQRVCTPLITVP